jgi:hypothetical protein
VDSLCERVVRLLAAAAAAAAARVGMVAVVCDKSQDNFSTVFSTMVTTVVGVQCKEKDLLSIRRRRVVLPPRRSAADCRIQKKKVETQPQLVCSHATTFASHTAGIVDLELVIGNARGDASPLLDF